MAQQVGPEMNLQQDVPSVFKNDNIFSSPCWSGPVSFPPSVDIGTDVHVKSSCWVEKSGVEVGLGACRQGGLEHTMLILCYWQEEWVKVLTGPITMERCEGYLFKCNRAATMGTFPLVRLASLRLGLPRHGTVALPSALWTRSRGQSMR